MIGYITKPELGAAMVTRDGGEIAIRAQGWNAFPEATPAETPVETPTETPKEQKEDAPAIKPEEN